MKNKFLILLFLFLGTAFATLILWDSVGVLIFHAQPITIYTAFGFALLYKGMEKWFKSLL
jgi:hypothetical protein